VLVYGGACVGQNASVGWQQLLTPMFAADYNFVHVQCPIDCFIEIFGKSLLETNDSSYIAKKNKAWHSNEKHLLS
jgi:hypothetical protein